jgi:hypothetical protein
MLPPLLDDFEEDTRPDCRSGFRRKLSERSLSFERMADECLARLSRLGTRTARNLSIQVHLCRREFQAWRWEAPTAIRRAAIVNDFLALHLQAQSLLRGER